MAFAELKTDPIGTPHHMARCCWCRQALTVGQVLALRCWLCPTPGCTARQVERALIVTVSASMAKGLGVPEGRQCLNVPLPSQVLFEESEARNILWGGQAGPGKSHGVRWWLYKRSLTVPGHTALLLRETSTELETTHLRFIEREVPLIGGVFRKGPPASVYFPVTKAYIDCGHMADSEAVRRYLGTEYGAIVAEEGSTYPLNEHGVSPLGELSTRTGRAMYRDTAGRPVPSVFIVPSNPGGASSDFLMDFFVDHQPDFDVYPALKKVYDPARYAYIPATLDDNPYMDPEYESHTLAILPKWRYEQLRRGDWHAFAGAFFTQWRASHHVRDLGTPTGVQWFRSLDWGRNQPGCVLWWAVLPDGRLYIRKDWKFQGKDEPEVAAGIRAIDKQLDIAKVAYTAGDPATRNKTGATHKDGGFVGQSILETLGHYGVPITPADNDRFNGWARCQAILRDAPDGAPWCVVHPDCGYLIRSIPAARSDKHDPDDVDTRMDDHALDAWRYGAMSRYGSGATKAKPKAFTPGMVGHLKEQALSAARKARRFGRVN
jgi:hypothetical protein